MQTEPHHTLFSPRDDKSLHHSLVITETHLSPLSTHRDSNHVPLSFAPPSSPLFFTALPRQRIQLEFDKNYYIEPSFECRFDHIEIRDGPFGFSPLIDRFCGGKNPGLVTSTGRFMWIKFTSDEELEGLGFRIKYIFIAGGNQPVGCGTTAAHHLSLSN